MSLRVWSRKDQVIKVKDVWFFVLPICLRSEKKLSMRSLNFIASDDTDDKFPFKAFTISIEEFLLHQRTNQMGESSIYALSQVRSRCDQWER